MAKTPAPRPAKPNTGGSTKKVILKAPAKPNTGGSTKKVILKAPAKPNTGGSTKKVILKGAMASNTGGTQSVAQFEKGKKDKKIDRTKGIREGSKKDTAVDQTMAANYPYKKRPRTVVAKGIKGTGSMPSY